jgi:hypothetical protein
MTRFVRDTLKTAQAVLWELIVRHERKELDLADMREQVDFAERMCGESLEQLEGDGDAESNSGDAD